MISEVMSAVIAAAVSTVVAIVSFVTNRYSLNAERRKLERELQRRMTEKLIDRRLSSYPLAFKITEKLTSSAMQTSNYRVRDVHAIQNEIRDWNRTEAAFLMSDKALKAFYRLRESMDLEGRDSDAALTDSEASVIWHAKNHFRETLRQDINLLYSEDGTTEQAPSPLQLAHRGRAEGEA